MVSDIRQMIRETRDYLTLYNNLLEVKYLHHLNYFVLYMNEC
jgi:hypothetical protein